MTKWVGGAQLDRMLYQEYGDPDFFKNNLKEITIKQAKSNLNKGTPDHSRFVRKKLFNFFKNNIGKEADIEKIAGYKFDQTERSNIVRSIRVQLTEEGMALEKVNGRRGTYTYISVKEK